MDKVYKTNLLWKNLVKLHRFSSQDCIRIGQQLFLQTADRQRRLWTEQGYLRKLTPEECINLGLWKQGRSRLAWCEVVKDVKKTIDTK